MLQILSFLKLKLITCAAAALLLTAALMPGCARNTQMYRIKLYSNGTFIREWQSPDGVIYRSNDNNIYFNTADNKLIRITAGELKIEAAGLPAQRVEAQHKD